MNKQFDRQIFNLAYVAIFACLIAAPAAAYYQPEEGRFLQRDPLGMNVEDIQDELLMAENQYQDGMSLYQYAVSSPVCRSDPFGTKSILDILSDQTLGYSISKTFPVAPLGPGIVHLTFTGSITRSVCCSGTINETNGCKKCDGIEKKMTCFEGDIELYWAAGKSGRTRERRREREAVPGRRKRSSDEVEAGYRDRDGYITHSTSDMPLCTDGIKDVSIRVFIRGSAGAYVGVQGAMYYDAWRITEGWDLSWERLSGEFGAARGIYGASIEVGGGGHISGCLTE